jgi:hypothetical protein
LVNQSEEETDCDTVTPGQALKIIFNATKCPGSVLLTPLPPDGLDAIVKG